MLEATSLTTPAGVPFSIRVAHPKGAGSGPGLVLIHEWYGLVPETERMAQQFADAGFVVAAVDLYGGRVATTDADAMALMMAMDSVEACGLVAEAARHLASLPSVRGKIGMTGFCMGGAVTLVAACRVAEIAAFVPFYGLPRPDRVDWTATRGPIQAHFARVDAWASPEKAEALVAEVNAAGGRATLYTYEGGHAFMRSSDPGAYHEESARLAFERATVFLHEELDA